MENNINRSKRLMIPKWRNYENTKILGELSSIEKDNKNLFEKEFYHKKNEWIKKKDFTSAMELLIYKEIEDENVEEAVKYIRDNNYNNEVSGLNIEHNPNIIESNIETNYNISKIKKILEKYPRNAIRWVDLSLLYTTVGEEKKAINAMKIAVQLDKNNRFVVRSGVRLFLHYNQFDYAYYILKISDLLNRDPWINASYIAVSQLMGKKINNIKISKYFIESNNFRKFDISELACSIGTLQLANGKDKDAKKMFKESFIDPNDNTAAQLQWISRNLINLQDVEKMDTRKIKNNYEFETIKRCYLEDFDNALKNAEKWIDDEVTSTIPNLVTSSLYTSIFENYEKGEEKINEGLKKEKNNLKLNTQLAFCKINKGEFEQAEKILDWIESKTNDIENKIFVLADKGMMNFRMGEKEKGENYYKEAIELANENKLIKLKASAIFHLAKEKYKSKSSTFLESIREARELYKYIDDPLLVYNIKKFEDKINS